jgi:hypothetical protein
MCDGHLAQPVPTIRIGDCNEAGSRFSSKLRHVAPSARLRAIIPKASPIGLVVRGYGVMLVGDAPVAVDLAQADGQPK